MKEDPTAQYTHDITNEKLFRLKLPQKKEKKWQQQQLNEIAFFNKNLH